MSNLHISLTEFKNESRILKETNSFLKYNLFQSIHIIALHNDGLPELENLDPQRSVWRIRLKSRKLPKNLPFQVVKFCEFLINIFIFAKRIRPRVINIHSLALLPIGVVLKYLLKSRLIYDAHELETEVEGLRGARKAVAKFVERILIYRCDAVLVVNQSIATWYKNTYKLTSVWVVHNFPLLSLHAPIRKGLLRRNIGLNDVDAVLFIYQGNLSSGRGIELIIQVFSSLSCDHHVVFMGYGPLIDVVKHAALIHSNIHFHAAVPPDLVKDYTADADVGLSLIQNTCLSYYLSAPNKIYEYANCGVVPIVSNFPEMRNFIDDSECGWGIEPTVLALSCILQSITKESLFEKKQKARTASLKYSWENEEAELINMMITLKLGHD